MAEPSYRRLFWGLALVGAVLDQVTKYGVFGRLSNGGAGGQYEVIPGVFELLAQFARHPETGAVVPKVNHGALFGFLGHHVGLANALFAAVSFVAAVAITVWATRPAAARDLGLSAALGLILAGTLGNLYDRLLFNGVRDFLHVHYENAFDWPVFNVADCCLVCGAFLLLGLAFFAKPAPADDTAAPGAERQMAEAR